VPTEKKNPELRPEIKETKESLIKLVEAAKAARENL